MSAETARFMEVGDNSERSLVVPLINETAARLGINGIHVETVDGSKLGLDPGADSVAPRFFEEIADGDVLGVSVTSPYTTKILPRFVTDGSSRLDDRNLTIQAVVDTVTYNPGDFDRPWILSNSDSIAVAGTLAENKVTIADKNIVIIGAGGAARAAAFAVAERQAGNIVIANRNLAKANDLVADIEELVNRGSHYGVHSERLTNVQSEKLGDLDSDSPIPDWAIDTADIVINGTPIGQNGHVSADKMPLSARQLATRLPLGAVILDTVYDPGRTPLVACASPEGPGFSPYRRQIEQRQYKVIEGTQWALNKANRQFVEFNNALVRVGEGEPLTQEQKDVAKELMKEVLARVLHDRNQ